MAAELNLKFPRDFFKTYAKGKACMVRISSTLTDQGCTSTDTTVLAHYTMPGFKAMGSRSASMPDLCAAWACSRCHDLVDGRLEPTLMGVANFHEIRKWHLEGVMRTLEQLVRDGVLPNP